MTTITISSGVTSSGVLVSGGSTLVVDGGGISVGAVVYGTEIVSTGGKSLGDYIEAGGVADVFGLANTTIVHFQASETIEAGGVGDGAQVAFGGELIVDQGGVAEAAVVTGLETVSQGGKSLGDDIQRSGAADVYGSASGTIVRSGASQTIEAGGVGSAVSVHEGGVLVVDDGGVSVAPVVSGLEIVSSGGDLRGGYIEHRTQYHGPALEVYGSASAIVVRKFATGTIEVGGSASGLVDDGGSIDIFGSAYETEVSSGYMQIDGFAENLRMGGADTDVYVMSGGVAISVTVSDIGEGLGLFVDGGTLTSAVVSSGAGITISDGGVASDVVVDSGYIGLSGGRLVNAYIRSGAEVGIEAAGDVAIDLRISSGGQATVDASATASGGYVLNGGLENVLGTISAAVVSSGGVVKFYTHQAVAENLALRPGAELFVSWTAATAEISGGVLEVMSGAQEVQSITLSGGGAGLGVIATPSSSGFTEITVTRDGPDAVRAARTPNAALFAQAKAALGDGGALPGSSTIHGGGTSSAVAEVLKPR